MIIERKNCIVNKNCFIIMESSNHDRCSGYSYHGNKDLGRVDDNLTRSTLATARLKPLLNELSSKLTISPTTRIITLVKCQHINNKNDEDDDNNIPTNNNIIISASNSSSNDLALKKRTCNRQNYCENSITDLLTINRKKKTKKKKRQKNHTAMSSTTMSNICNYSSMLLILSSCLLLVFTSSKFEFVLAIDKLASQPSGNYKYNSHTY